MHRAGSQHRSEDAGAAAHIPQSPLGPRCKTAQTCTASQQAAGSTSRQITVSRVLGMLSNLPKEPAGARMGSHRAAPRLRSDVAAAKSIQNPSSAHCRDSRGCLQARVAPFQPHRRCKPCRDHPRADSSAALAAAPPGRVSQTQQRGTKSYRSLAPCEPLAPEQPTPPRRSRRRWRPPSRAWTCPGRMTTKPTAPRRHPLVSARQRGRRRGGAC